MVYRADLRRASLPHQRQNARNQTAIPSKAGAIEERGSRVVEQCHRIFKHMPQLGADDTQDGDEGYNADRVRLHVKALEVQVKHVAGADCRQPQHETEGTDGEWA